MMQPKGIYALWYRESKVFARQRSRVISSIANPLLWFAFVGGGIGSVVSIEGINYQTFIYPGVLMQAVIFSSIFYGVYIVWDKRIDFLKEVIVSPMSRTSIFIGKVLGGSTETTIQTVILLLIAIALSAAGLMHGINLNPLTLLLTFIILSITTAGMASVGLILGSQMESPEGFELVISFVIFPLFFLSGALYPINNLPPWLAPLTLLDPATYAVDALRATLLGTSTFPMALDIAVITAFTALMITIGTQAFKKMKI